MPTVCLICGPLGIAVAEGLDVVELVPVAAELAKLEVLAEAPFIP